MCLLDEIHKRVTTWLVFLKELTLKRRDLYFYSRFYLQWQKTNDGTFYSIVKWNERTCGKGPFNGGRVFGYSSTPAKKLQINEHEAKIVRFIFDRYVVDGWGYKKSPPI